MLKKADFEDSLNRYNLDYIFSLLFCWRFAKTASLWRNAAEFHCLRTSGSEALTFQIHFKSSSSYMISTFCCCNGDSYKPIELGRSPRHLAQNASCARMYVVAKLGTMQSDA